MASSLLELITRLQQKPLSQSALEEQAKFSVILPVLDRLGWESSDPDEFVAEHRVGTQRVDFCLRLSGVPRVFIEAKKPSEDLETHQSQLLNYAFKEGVDVAVLTNGIVWWFYLPKANGGWEQRKFFTIDVRQQQADAIAEHFETYLSRSAIANGLTVRAATALLDNATRLKVVVETLPQAWARLLSEPDELLVELVAEAVEGRSGHRPDSETVAAFLAQRLAGPPINPSTPPGKVVVPLPSRPQSDGINTGVTGRAPTGFILFGERRGVTTWKQVLLGVAAELFQRHSTEFDAVLSIRGKKRAYFATSSDPLFEPSPIPDSPYFAETNSSANDIVRRCALMLALFGHSETDLVIESH